VNLVLLFEGDFTHSDRVHLADERHRHITRVLQAGPGDTLRVGLLGGAMGEGTIITRTADRTELTVTLHTPPPPKLPLTLLLALPRPKVARRILAGCAELGIARVVLLNAWRVEKSFWQSPLLAPDAIQQTLVTGLQQARDTVLPEVTLRQRFKPFVEDELPMLLRDAHGLLAHPGATPPCPQAPVGNLVLAVGPEGGFIPYEVDMLAAAGMQRVTFGPRILRVETAVAAIVGQLYGGGAN
jgi:RsmE family RNA methyltransferase